MYRHLLQLIWRSGHAQKHEHGRQPPVHLQGQAAAWISVDVSGVRRHVLRHPRLRVLLRRSEWVDRVQADHRLDLSSPPGAGSLAHGTCGARGKVVHSCEALALGRGPARGCGRAVDLRRGPRAGAAGRWVAGRSARPLHRGGRAGAVGLVQGEDCASQLNPMLEPAPPRMVGVKLVVV